MDMTLFLVPVFLAVVLFSISSLLCLLPFYLPLHFKGRYLVLMIEGADECYTSEVNLVWWNAT